MFYSQNVDNIQLVILTLDGGLLDLNRLRYNYFKRTCESYNKTISKEQFSFMLGSMKTMYDKSPVQDIISAREYNKMVEKDLFEYVKLKPQIKREGVDEFIQYCLQKNIKIAVYTTHKSKRAMQYLQLTELYSKIDFLIGGDSQLLPLPHQDVLTVICQQLNVDPRHTLVVANFESMVEAALNMYANVIYMPDLAPANDTIRACVYKVVKNYFEIMNVFLFSKYDSMEMFSPILGMNADMDRDTLYATKNKLLDKYQNDDQLIALVNKTYDYFIDLLNKQEISDRFSRRQKIFFEFDDEDEVVPASVQNEKAGTVQADSEQKVQNIMRNINQTSMKNSDTFILSGATSYDPQRMNELMDIINGEAKKDKETDNVASDQSETETEEENGIVNLIMNILFNFLLAMIIVLVAIMFNLLFADSLEGTSLFAQIVNYIYTFYISIVNTLFGLIFNGVHLFVPAFPNYEQFVYHNSTLSTMASLSLLSVIFNFIWISVVRMIIYRFNRKEIA